MKKSVLTAIVVLGTVGGILLSVGMCMCLLPAWNAFVPGVVLALIGAVALLSCWPISRKASGKSAIHLTPGYAVAVLLGLAGAFALGIGLVNCLQTVTSFGLAVGIVGLMLILLSILVGRKASGRCAIPFNGRLVLSYVIGIAGALVLGVGMCLTMVWSTASLVPGIVIGAVGLMVCILNLALRIGKKAG